MGIEKQFSEIAVDATYLDVEDVQLPQIRKPDKVAVTIRTSVLGFILPIGVAGNVTSRPSHESYRTDENGEPVPAQA